MTAKNDITGDVIQTRESSDAYRDGWERIFGKKPTKLADIIAEFPQERQDEINALASQKAAEMQMYHLRSYGDVSKEELDAYAARRPAAPDSASR